MGMFRSSSRKREGGQDKNEISRANSFDTTLKDGSSIPDNGRSKSRNSRFLFRHRSVGRSSNGSITPGGDTPATKTRLTTPTTITEASLAANVTTATATTQRTITPSPGSAFSSRNDDSNQHSGDEVASATSSSAMLESLKILSSNDERFASPARSLYNSVEVLTPESRQILLQQREVIRKILFDSNDDGKKQSNASMDLEPSPYHRVISDYDENDDDKDDVLSENVISDTEDPRASPPPPPPPPELDHPNDSMASCASQEVSVDGLVRNASADELDVDSKSKYMNHRNYQTPEEYRIARTITKSSDEGQNELHDLKILSTQGRNMPISVDLSYTESELASLSSKRNGPAPSSYESYRSGNAKSRGMPISVDLSYTESELASVRSSIPPQYDKNGINNLQSRNVIHASYGDERFGNSRDEINQPQANNNGRSSDIAPSKAPFTPGEDENVLKNLGPYSGNVVNDFLQKPSPNRKLHQADSIANAEVAALEAVNDHSARMNAGARQSLHIRRPSPASSLPDDERDYDTNFHARVSSPMPDDERMEYNKHEMLDRFCARSTGSALNVVAVRSRPLSGGGLSGLDETDIVGRDPGTRSKDISEDEINGKSSINDALTRNTNLNESIDSTYVSFGYDENDDDKRRTSPYMCSTTNPVTSNILKALSCANGTEVYDVDDKVIPKDGQMNHQKEARGPWVSSPVTSQSYNAEVVTRENSLIVKKSPSFFYTNDDDDVTARFVRRVTNYGFVLLHLQAPGSLGNPAEDWSGRTVTLTIEKGISPSLPSNKLGFSSDSGCSSVTFSVRSTANNSITSNRTSALPIIQHPRLQWMTVAGGLTTDVSTTSVDLLNIQAISIDDSGDNEDTKKDTPAQEDLCFFTITTSEGVVHMFEAASLEERNRIVRGLKSVIARLSFHLISGNPTSTSELYSNTTTRHNDLSSVRGRSLDRTLKSSAPEMNQASTQTVPLLPEVSELSQSYQEARLSDAGDRDPGDRGDLPVLRNPSETMNRVAHIFLDI